MAAAHALLSIEPLGILGFLGFLELLESLELLEILGYLASPPRPHRKSPPSLDVNQVSLKNQTFF